MRGKLFFLGCFGSGFVRRFSFFDTAEVIRAVDRQSNTYYRRIFHEYITKNLSKASMHLSQSEFEKLSRQVTGIQDTYHAKKEFDTLISIKMSKLTEMSGLHIARRGLIMDMIIRLPSSLLRTKHSLRRRGHLAVFRRSTRRCRDNSRIL